MQQQLQRGIQILILMTAGIMTGLRSDGAQPPTRGERDDVQQRLNSTEGKHKAQQTEVQKSTLLLDNLTKSIDALEKTLDPLGKTEGGEDLKLEVQKMRDTLAKLKTIREKSQKDLDAGRTNSNGLQRELQSTLAEYFNKADPKMVATRYGVPFDGIDFDGTAEFMKLTREGKSPPMHYALGAEHTWADTFWWTDSRGGWHYTPMESISQHEQVTTRDIHDMAQQLLSKVAPGMKVPVARAGITVNDTHLNAHPEAYRGIFGNKSFTPSVLNNSTRWGNDLHETKVYRSMMDLYTRGEGTRTLTTPDAQITYGVPSVGLPILCNSAGNGGWADRPNFTIVKNFYPNRMNIGVSAVPEIEGKNRRNDKAPPEIEDYSSGCSVDAIIQRPRWNADGTAVKTQYLNPNYKQIIEDNLWKMVGKPKPKSPKDLDDVTVYPPELVTALKADVELFAKAAMRSEGTDEQGLHYNLRGTSFASPNAAGVILAARMLYPDASPSEVMDAFMSACEPIYLRKPLNEPTRDDVLYMVDEKTGWRFAPQGAGYGEFVIRENATQAEPDSWIKMTQRLKLMQEERMKLTKNGRAETRITVGEGADRREVVLNGQPSQMTIEMSSFKNDPGKSVQDEDKRWENHVHNAFERVQMYNDLSFMIDKSGEIPTLIKAHKYTEALAKLKAEVIDTKYVSDKDPYYVDAVKAVEDAEKHRAYTYSVNVPPTHDMCCSYASLRVKFKDTARTDQFMVLESPDGRMIPITMSGGRDGYEVGSTSGFLRQSAIGTSKSGTWKIHTHHELDTSNSSLVLSGTERNPELGIIDVRETVLSKLEMDDAKARTNVPEKNRTAITNPHETLRQLNGLSPMPKAKGKSALMPATYEDQRDYMQGLIDESNLRKGGFIPAGTLWREGLGERPDKGGQKAAPILDKPLLDAVKQLFNLFSMSNSDIADPSRNPDAFAKHWGDMAEAAQRGEIPTFEELAHKEHPAHHHKPLSFAEGANDPDLAYWQRKHRREQIKAARESQHSNYKIA